MFFHNLCEDAKTICFKISILAEMDTTQREMKGVKANLADTPVYKQFVLWVILFIYFFFTPLLSLNRRGEVKRTPNNNITFCFTTVKC